MYKKIIIVAMLLCGISTISAATVDFDDIDASFGDVSIDFINPYQGFSWTNFTAYTTTPGFPGFNSGIVSSDNAAYSGGELFGTTIAPVIGKIESTSPFDFVSAYLGSGYYDNLALTVEGRMNGNLLFTQSVILNTSSPLLVNFGFSNIDELDFFASTTSSTIDPFQCGTVNCTQFTIDNLLFATASSPPPPPQLSEPSSLVLFLLAWILAAIFRRTE